MLLSRHEVATTGLDCHQRGQPPAPAEAQWPHRTRAPAGTAPAAPLRFGDVGVGIMVPPSHSFLRAAGIPSAHRPPDNTHASLREMCDRKWEPEPLACALSTWGAAAGPSLDVLLLVDCLHYCAESVPRARRPAACAQHGGGSNASSFGEHTPFDFATPPWLARTSGRDTASVTLRCYWGAFFAGDARKGAVATNVEKGAALHRAMHDVLPPKAFYVKMDSDTALWPPRLMALLGFVHVRLRVGAAVHLGSTTLGHGKGETTRTWAFVVNPQRYDILRQLEAARPSLSPAAKLKLFGERTAALGLAVRAKEGLSAKQKELVSLGKANKSELLARRRVSTRAWAMLRETRAWRALEATFLSPDEAAAARRRAVNFGQGALFAHSRAALASLVRSDCLRKVSELKCEVPCRRSKLTQCEDAAVGLCMHLLRIPFVDSSCIVGGVVGGTVVARQMLDRMKPTCRRPIAFHPLKNRKDYLKQWAHFEADEQQAKLLHARGQTCGAPEAAEEAAVEAGDTSTRAAHDFGNALAHQGKDGGTVRPTTVAAQTAASTLSSNTLSELDALLEVNTSTSTSACLGTRCLGQ